MISEYSFPTYFRTSIDPVTQARVGRLAKRNPCVLPSDMAEHQLFESIVESDESYEMRQMQKYDGVNYYLDPLLPVIEWGGPTNTGGYLYDHLLTISRKFALEAMSDNFNMDEIPLQNDDGYIRYNPHTEKMADRITIEPPGSEKPRLKDSKPRTTNDGCIVRNGKFFINSLTREWISEDDWNPDGTWAPISFDGDTDGAYITAVNGDRLLLLFAPNEYQMYVARYD